MIDKEAILRQLQSFQFAVGHPVLVHTSLRAIGPIKGGANTLLDTLIEFFAKDNGLLCIPTHTWDETVMDLRTPRTCIGTLPNIAACRTDGIRSLHPTHSMMVFGNTDQARSFVDCDRTVTSPASPYGTLGKLHDQNGYVLLLGVGHERNTFLHCVEEMMHVPFRLTSEIVQRTIIYPNGQTEVRNLYWFDEEYNPDVSEYFGKYEPAFRYHGCITDGVVGNCRAQLCSAKAMKQVMELVRRNSGGAELLCDFAPLPRHYYEHQAQSFNVNQTP